MRDHRLCDLLAACASVIRLANHVRHTNAKNPPMDDQSVNDPTTCTGDRMTRIADQMIRIADQIANDPRHPEDDPNGDDQSVNDQMNWTDDPFVDVLVNCRLATLDWGQAFVVDASYWEDSQNLP
jgi:hypothetical protein